MNKCRDSDNYTTKQIFSGVVGAFGLGLGAFIASRYRICKPNEYLVKTGLGINNMSIHKKTIVWPFQQTMKVPMNPLTFQIGLECMTRENIPFNLPVNVIAMPYDPFEEVEVPIGDAGDEDKLIRMHGSDLFKNYCKRMLSSTEYQIQETINTSLHGDARTLTANLTIDTLFSSRKEFNKNIYNLVQPKLNNFGLKIANLNIAEMQDHGDSKIFKFRAQKAIETEINSARIEVAEQKRKGDIGEEEKKANTMQKISEFNSKTVEIQNENALKIAESTKILEVNKAKFSQEMEIAKLSAEKAKEIREVELQKEVELKRIEKEKEALRATDLTKAQVSAEAKVAEAQGISDAMIKTADAELYAEQKRAEAKLAIYLAEAKGTEAKYNAEAAGIMQLFDACKSDPNIMKFILANNAKLYQQIAQESAKAIQGLNPKINIWSSGQQDSNVMKTITDIFKTVPPLLDVMDQQLGIKIPGLYNGSNSSNGYNESDKK
jgi:flotillin